MILKKLLILLCLLISGCGFHLRQPSDLPPELHSVKLESSNVNNAISSGLRSELRALNASLDDSKAPITVRLSNSKSNTDIPTVFNANADTNYVYTLSVTLTVKSATGKVIHKSLVEASESVLHNVNQVSPPVFTPLMRSTLTKKLVDNIYTLLTSRKVLLEIDHANDPTTK